MSADSTQLHSVHHEESIEKSEEMRQISKNKYKCEEGKKIPK